MVDIFGLSNKVRCMKNCPNCSQATESSDQFCAACGANLALTSRPFGPLMLRLQTPLLLFICAVVVTLVVQNLFLIRHFQQLFSQVEFAMLPTSVPTIPPAINP